MTRKRLRSTSATTAAYLRMFPHQSPSACHAHGQQRERIQIYSLVLVMAPLFDITPASLALETLLSVPCPFVDTTPILLVTSISDRQLRLGKLRSALSDADATLSAIYILEEKVKTLRRRFDTWKAGMVQSHSSVIALPDELLTGIFEMVAEGDASGGWRTGITLSHVCSQWRATSVGFSKLWSKLELSSLAQSGLLPLCAHRSRNLRLRLTVRAYSSRVRHVEWPPTSIHIGPDEAPQIASLSFLSYEAHKALHVPNSVQHLLDLNDVSFDLSYTTLHLSDYLATARHLRLGRADLADNPVPHFPRLTKLTIVGQEADRVLNALHMLNTTSLQQLEIFDMDESDNDVQVIDTRPANGDILTLDSLTSLRIMKSDPVAWSWLAGKLVLDHLDCLSVEAGDHWRDSLTSVQVGHHFADLVSLVKHVGLNPKMAHSSNRFSFSNLAQYDPSP